MKETRKTRGGNTKRYKISSFDEQWQNQFLELQNFKAVHGHFRVGRQYRTLYHWVCDQRKFFKRGKLKEDRIQNLLSGGFSFEAGRDTWDKSFERLKAFKAEHGHFSVPRKGEVRSLAFWLSKQRKQLKRGMLPECRREKLESIGFWDTVKGSSEEESENLLTEQTPIEAKSSARRSNRHLQQQDNSRNGAIPPHKLEKLKSIVFLKSVNVREDCWEQRLSELDAFRVKNGHVNVPKKCKALHNWIDAQKSQFQRGEMPIARVGLLQSAGLLLQEQRTSVKRKRSMRMSANRENNVASPGVSESYQENDNDGGDDKGEDLNDGKEGEDCDDDVSDEEDCDEEESCGDEDCNMDCDDDDSKRVTKRHRSSPLSLPALAHPSTQLAGLPIGEDEKEEARVHKQMDPQFAATISSQSFQQDRHDKKDDIEIHRNHEYNLSENLIDNSNHQQTSQSGFENKIVIQKCFIEIVRHVALLVLEQNCK